MFTLKEIEHYAGIKIAAFGKEKEYVFSLEYFMAAFVEFFDEIVKHTPSFAPKAIIIAPPVGSKEYFAFSQAITAGAKKVSDIDLDSLSETRAVPLNARVIYYPDGSSCYIFDDELVDLEGNTLAKKEVSYLLMAKQFQKAMKEERITDSELARSVLDIMLNGAAYDDKGFEMRSIMIAALFMAEPKRNPSSFLPSLMLLDLIQGERFSRSEFQYRWANCLQNPVLVYDDKDADHDAVRTKLDEYALATEMPTQAQLTSGAKMSKIPENVQELINMKKVHNGRENQNSISPSEFLMQHGGYFPMTHRFSYSELVKKRAEKTPTLSDIKSFIAMVDWLEWCGLAKRIGRNAELEAHKDKDSQKSFLMAVAFPRLWYYIDALIIRQCSPTNLFNESPGVSLNQFPAAFSRYGCRPNKLTAALAAQALFLISASAKYKDDFEKIKLQFFLWNLNHKVVNIEEVERIMNTTYDIDSTSFFPYPKALTEHQCPEASATPEKVASALRSPRLSNPRLTKLQFLFWSMRHPEIRFTIHEVEIELSRQSLTSAI